MGYDCVIKVDNKYYSLDRWYVFSSEFEFEKEYTKQEALKKIRNINKTERLKYLTSHWEERKEEFFKYYKYWLLKTRKIIKSNKAKKICFYFDGNLPEEYYDNYNKQN